MSRFGRPNIAAPEDENLGYCYCCKRNLSLTAFAAAKEQKMRKGMCKECRNAAQRKKYAENEKERAYHHSRHIKNTYNLSAEELETLIRTQNNLCAICMRDMGFGKSRHVDHCHTTGVVRGLLCSRCNVALGFVDDNVVVLKKMITYLEKIT